MDPKFSLRGARQRVSVRPRNRRAPRKNRDAQPSDHARRAAYGRLMRREQQVHFGGQKSLGDRGRERERARRAHLAAKAEAARAAALRAALRAAMPPYVPPTVAERTRERAIPRRIVQSWVNRAITPEIGKLCASHRRCNPGYGYVFYDDKGCRDFIKEHFRENVLLAYDALIPGAFKADLFRYCELYINGGWWFDIDMLSVGSIDAFVGAEVAFACPRDGGIPDSPALYQALLGSSKGNSVLEKAIREVVDTVAGYAGANDMDALSYTGPRLLGRCVAEVLPGTLAAAGTNTWADSRTAAFGNSRKLDGHCVIGTGVICIGHSGDKSTNVQAMIHSAYTGLRRSTGEHSLNDYRRLSSVGVQPIDSSLLSQHRAERGWGPIVSAAL